MIILLRTGVPNNTIKMMRESKGKITMNKKKSTRNYRSISEMLDGIGGHKHKKSDEEQPYTGLRRPGNENKPSDPSKTEDIIRMIRERHEQAKEKHAKEQQASFHDFKELEPATNAMGLYLQIIEDIQGEKDPEKIRGHFEYMLQMILEDVPDDMATYISDKIWGLP